MFERSGLGKAKADEARSTVAVKVQMSDFIGWFSED